MVAAPRGLLSLFAWTGEADRKRLGRMQGQAGFKQILDITPSLRPNKTHNLFIVSVSTLPPVPSVTINRMHHYVFSVHQYIPCIYVYSKHVYYPLFSPPL